MRKLMALYVEVDSGTGLNEAAAERALSDAGFNFVISDIRSAETLEELCEVDMIPVQASSSTFEAREELAAGSVLPPPFACFRIGAFLRRTDSGGWLYSLEWVEKPDER